MSYRIFSSLFRCCFDPFLVLLPPPSLYRVIPGLFLSLYMLFRSCSCSSSSSYSYLLLLLWIVELIFNGFERTSFASRTSYCIHPSLFHQLVLKVSIITRSWIDSDGSDLRSTCSKATLPVLINQIIPSKDNELRLNKAARSHRHHNKEVTKRKEWEM